MNYSRSSVSGYYIDTDWDTHLTSVRITDTLYGVSARGHAKLHPTDNFDIQIGYSIAYTRALARLLTKVAVKMAKEPEIVRLTSARTVSPIMV